MMFLQRCLPLLAAACLTGCDRAPSPRQTAPNPKPSVSAPAPTPMKGPWFRPAPYAWALQEVLAANRLKPSTAWRETVAEGTQAPIEVPWSSLKPRSGWTRAVATLAPDASSAPFWEASWAADSPALLIPALPEGGFWMKLRFYGPGWVSLQNYFLNIVESGGDHPLPRQQLDAPHLRVLAGDGGVKVTGLSDAPDASLRVIVSGLDSRRLSTFVQEIEPGKAEVFIPIPEAVAGKTVDVAVLQQQGDKVTDRDGVWLSTPGDFPGQPQWTAAEGQTPPSVLDFPSGETMSTQGSFEEQRQGLETQIAGMAQRGSRTIQLWISWGKTEPVLGARDWSNLDAYVNFLTEHKIPFVLAGPGSVLFGNGPTAMWGDWAMNHEGQYNLWRKLPIVSPASTAYRQAAMAFTRALVERYRGNPYLAGYGFLNQGTDSGVYQEHYDSILDYSAASRRGFRQFLQNRYDSLDALNQAWGTTWASWDHIQPPMPELDKEVNLTPAWKDWTDWKLQTYRFGSVDLFDPILAELDPERPAIHYNAKTGPFEYNFRNLKLKHWATADGAGEDYRMGRINGITKNWGLWRQTESHNVPPNNKRYLMDMWAESLRNGGNLIRYNLVFNSLASLFVDRYPKDEKLQEALGWWMETAPLRAQLTQSVTTPPRTGVFLSWTDMLYRGRVWRWYAMPGDRADTLVRRNGFLPVSWLSEWTPENAWKGIDVLLVPEDALVWDAGLAQRLRLFVENGGQLILWGRAGQYTASASSDQAQPFPWFKALGLEGAQAQIAGKEASDSLSKVELGKMRVLMAPGVTIDNLPEKVTAIRDARDRPQILSWDLGKGKVRWCLSTTKGESDRVVAALLQEAGAPQEIVTSRPGVDAFLVHLDGTRYIILNRYLGFNVKAEDVPLSTQTKLPGLPDGTWKLQCVVPAGGEAREMTAAELAEEGFKSELLPSQMLVYALSPEAP